MVWRFRIAGNHRLVVPRDPAPAVEDQQTIIAYYKKQDASAKRKHFLLQVGQQLFYFSRYQVTHLIELDRFHIFRIGYLPVDKLFGRHPGTGIAAAHCYHRVERSELFYFIEAFAVVPAEVVAQLPHGRNGLGVYDAAWPAARAESLYIFAAKDRGECLAHLGTVAVLNTNKEYFFHGHKRFFITTAVEGQRLLN